MVATGFGTLTSYGVVNVNTNGFNNTGILLLRPGGSDKIYVNAGGVVNVTGNVGLCSNAVANVASGGTLAITGGLYVGSGATGGTSGGGVSSYATMTNSGGILTAAATGINIGNGSVSGNALLVISGGTNNLGNVTVKRSNAGSGGYATLGTEGLMIYGGLVNMTNLNVGGGNGNSFLTTMITGLPPFLRRAAIRVSSAFTSCSPSMTNRISEAVSIAKPTWRSVSFRSSSPASTNRRCLPRTGCVSPTRSIRVSAKRSACLTTQTRRISGSSPGPAIGFWNTPSIRPALSAGSCWNCPASLAWPPSC